MQHHRAKRAPTSNAVHKRQGGLVAYSWRDFLPEDIGELVQIAMGYGHGVLLGSSPSGELLVLRVYGKSGYTPIYGRSLSELVESLHKKFGTIVLSQPLQARRADTPPSAPLYGSVEYLVRTCGWAEEKARAFSSESEHRREWASKVPILERLRHVRRLGPPPL